MASTAAVCLVSLLAAVAPIILFVVQRKGGGEKIWALLAKLLREGQWPRRGRRSSASASPPSTTPHLLCRVAPSEHGFLPARVPDFSFDNPVLDGFVQIADAVPEQYAKEDTLSFRSWLEERLLELFPKGAEEEEEGGGNSRRRFEALDAALRSLDGERQRSLLVPLVFLAHAHRWGCTSPPQWVLEEGAKQKGEGKKRKWELPQELARALDSARASVGGIQRSGSVSLLFLRNWKLVDEGGEGGKSEEGKRSRKRLLLPQPGEPFSLSDLSQNSLRPRFFFCSKSMSNDCEDDLEAAEAAVLHSVVLTEAAASRLPPALLALFDAAEEAERAEADEARAKNISSSSSASEASKRADSAALAAATAAAEVSSALRAALSVFHDVFRTSKISTRAWSVHIQPFFCALTSREGEKEAGEEEEHGVGGAQIPWVHVTDALFGIAADDTLGSLIAKNRNCLLPEERLFVSFVEAHSLKVRRWLSRGGSGSGWSDSPPPRSEEARLHWNRALSTLVAWRATHRARAAEYLVPAGGGGGGEDAPRRGTTGGTAGYGGGRKKKEETSGSGDESAAPSPASTLSPPSFSSDGGENEEQEIRESFNRLMDGRIARTRASSIDGGRSGSGSGVGNNKNLSDLFPQAA